MSCINLDDYYKYKDFVLRVGFTAQALGNYQGQCQFIAEDEKIIKNTIPEGSISLKNEDKNV